MDSAPGNAGEAASPRLVPQENIPPVSQDTGNGEMVVRAHRAGGNISGRVNPTRSKTK